MRDEKITFADMRSLARRYAAAIAKSHQHNMPVAVFTNRTIEPAIWFLAVLYSGNYYVPIDPDMPVNEIQKIFADASFVTVLGSEENREKVNQIHFDGFFITLDSLTDEEYSNPATESISPAYMVYTSGSTGMPKGVLKSHGAIISFIEAYCETFHFSSEDVIGNQTPFFFDAAAKDFYLMLKMGTTIEIIPTELFVMTTQLIEYMNAKGITFASWVPTALSLVAQLSPFSIVKPETLKRMFFVGEVMPMKHLNKWRKEVPYVQYVNLYGQSKLAGICCYYEVLGEFQNDEVLPMGKPLKNCKVYLLDGEQIIHEPDLVGELYIVSDALATE